MKQLILAVFLLSASLEIKAENALPGALEAGWQGEKVCELLQEDEMTRVLRCTFPPGVGHERHYHPAHFGYTLKAGTMQITDASGVRVATSTVGSTWKSDGVAEHTAINIGETTSQYLVIEQKY